VSFVIRYRQDGKNMEHVTADVIGRDLVLLSLRVNGHEVDGIEEVARPQTVSSAANSPSLQSAL